MCKTVLRKSIIFIVLGLVIGTNLAPNLQIKADTLDDREIQVEILDMTPIPPDGRNTVDRNNLSKSAVILNNVPTSEWTYGCTATTAGMLFGYYDRIGYSNMYTGPTNGGVCPLTDLGQGYPGNPDYPIPGSCYIIATEQGLDGITTKAHVDDYWISYGSPGPDPWEGNWPEHTWELCVADFIGTSQWKWDTDLDGTKDHNTDGGTLYYYYSDGSKYYDPLPPDGSGTPRTATCHGCKLFAQSRGYTVNTNYNQLTNTPNGHPNGFTFNEFISEIDAGRPVITHWTSATSAHSMLGVGYDASSNTIYFHDTWDNNLHSTTWNGTYSSYNLELKAVTVIQLAPSGNTPPTFGTPSPPDGAVDQPISFTWQIPITDQDGDQFNWTIECSNGQSNTGTYDTDGIKSLSLSGLSYSTTYTVWVNASDIFGSGQSTNDSYTFTTRAFVPPTISTLNATNVQSTSAQLNGELVDMGDTTWCNVFFVWDTSYHNDWHDYTYSSDFQTMYNPGIFNEYVTGLSPDTTYHFRAVATHSQGGTQGADKTFHTPPFPPIVTTNPATNVMPTSAQLNGNLDDMGGASSCEVWFVWDTTYHSNWQDYVYSTPHQTRYSTGAFSDTISGLDPNVLYHFRAVASNNGGTSQGDDLVIINKINITTLSDNWNFIALPFNQSINKTDIMVNYLGSNLTWADAVAAGIISDYIFGWNRVGQTYTFNDVLEPGYGYWMYAYEPCELWIENIAISYDFYITDVEQNWNIISVPYNQPVSKTDIIVEYLGVDYPWVDAATAGIISGYLFGWDRTGQTYIFADTLEPGCCYWMYAYQSCTLKRTSS